MSPILTSNVTSFQPYSCVISLTYLSESSINHLLIMIAAPETQKDLDKYTYTGKICKGEFHMNLTLNSHEK